MSITISRNYDGALKLSSMMVNYYGEEFLYWKTYYGYTPEEAKSLFKQDAEIDNAGSRFSE
jgi:hypothetical protein